MSKKSKVKTKVKNCFICAEFATSRQKQPIQTVEIPELPYERISMDIGELTIDKGKIWLLISDFIEKRHFKEYIFSKYNRHGTPKVIHVDYGTHS